MEKMHALCSRGIGSACLGGIDRPSGVTVARMMVIYKGKDER